MSTETLGAQGQELQLLIKNPSRTHDETFRITIPSSASLQQLKEMLWEKYPGNPSPDRITIIYAGKVLKNDPAPLSSYLISEDSLQFVLHIVVKPIARPIVVSPPPQHRPLSPAASPAPHTTTTLVTAGGEGLEGAGAGAARNTPSSTAAAAQGSTSTVGAPTQPLAAARGVDRDAGDSSDSDLYSDHEDGAPGGAYWGMPAGVPANQRPDPMTTPWLADPEPVPGQEPEQAAAAAAAAHPQVNFTLPGVFPVPGAAPQAGASHGLGYMAGYSFGGQTPSLLGTAMEPMYLAAYNAALQALVQSTPSSTPAAAAAAAADASGAVPISGGTGGQGNAETGPTPGNGDAAPAQGANQQQQAQAQAGVANVPANVPFPQPVLPGGMYQVPVAQQAQQPGQQPQQQYIWYPANYAMPGYAYGLPNPGQMQHIHVQQHAHPQQYAPGGQAELRQRQQNQQLRAAQMYVVLQGQRRIHGRLPPEQEEFLEMMERHPEMRGVIPRARRGFFGRRNGVGVGGNPPVRQFQFRININVRVLLQLLFLMVVLYQHCSLRRFLTLIVLGMALYLTTLEPVRRFLFDLTGFQMPGHNPLQLRQPQLPAQQQRQQQGAAQGAGAPENAGQAQQQAPGEGEQQQQQQQEGQEAPLLGAQPPVQRPVGMVQGFVREIQAFVLGFLTSLLPGWNVNAEDRAAFAAAQDMFANQQQQQPQEQQGLL